LLEEKENQLRSMGREQEKVKEGKLLLDTLRGTIP
jgi:hypothetical protein